MVTRLVVLDLPRATRDSRTGHQHQSHQL